MRVLVRWWFLPRRHEVSSGVQAKALDAGTGKEPKSETNCGPIVPAKRLISSTLRRHPEPKIRSPLLTPCTTCTDTTSLPWCTPILLQGGVLGSRNAHRQVQRRAVLQRPITRCRPLILRQLTLHLGLDILASSQNHADARIHFLADLAEFPNHHRMLSLTACP